MLGVGRGESWREKEGGKGMLTELGSVGCKLWSTGFAGLGAEQDSRLGGEAKGEERSERQAEGVRLRE